jgi:hypothetical protein
MTGLFHMSPFHMSQLFAGVFLGFALVLMLTGRR